MGHLRHVRKCVRMVRGCLQPDLLQGKSARRSTWTAQSRQGRDAGYARRLMEVERRDVPRHVSPGSADRRFGRVLFHRLLWFPMRAPHHAGRVARIAAFGQTIIAMLSTKNKK